MGLTDDIEGDLASIFSPDEFGQAVTYTPADGQPISAVALLPQKSKGDTQEDGYASESAVIYVGAFDLGIVPAEGDLVEIDGEVWRVRLDLYVGGKRYVLCCNAFIWAIPLSRAERRVY